MKKIILSLLFCCIGFTCHVIAQNSKTVSRVGYFYADAIGKRQMKRQEFRQVFSA